MTFDGKNSGNVSDLVRVKFMIGCLLAPGGKVFVFVLTVTICNSFLVVCFVSFSYQDLMKDLMKTFLFVIIT